MYPNVSVTLRQTTITVDDFV